MASAASRAKAPANTASRRNRTASAADSSWWLQSSVAAIVRCQAGRNRLGPVPTLRPAGLLTAAGMLVALTAAAPVLVVAGFLVVGLALAAVLPIALSLAGTIGTTTAGAASSVVTTISYAGFLLGPILIGAVADAAGLRTALGVVTITGVLITVLASTVGPR